MTIPSNISLGELLSIYRTMFKIRAFEMRLAQEFKSGKLPGPVHVYIGQEAVAAGVCSHLSETDWITSTHRGHGHFLAKGGTPESFFQEIYGREGGICGGKGGSMHAADVSKGILGANGIVGAGISLATGAALTAQLQRNGAVAVSFFGDGAANQGVFAEALNVAALWKLPLIMVCENNGFSEFSRAEDVTSGKIVDRAHAFNVSAEEVDGNDVLAVWNVMARAVERARAGDGPTLIEARTYRLRGHVESETSFLAKPYRSEEEVELWKGRDPVSAFSALLLEHGKATGPQLQEIEREILDALENAMKEAVDAPWPNPDMALEHMFA
jgi:TPP-dependent pyruvate/acetoin dehydrogenase alpha subunit